MDPKSFSGLRIVFLSFPCWPPDFGGELLLSIERFQTMVKRGHSVVVLTRRPPGFARGEEQHTIRIRRSPVSGQGLVAQAGYIIWVAAMLLTMSFDTVHLGGMPGSRAPTQALAAWLFSTIAKARGARTVSVVSLADSETEAWLARGRTGVFRRVYYHKVDHIVAVSPSLFQPLDRWRPRKAILVTNGVRDDLFTPLSDEDRLLTRKQYEIPEGGVVFITIGSVGPRKGHDVLARAFATVGEKHRNWFLWLVGPRSRSEGCGTNERELAEIIAPLRQVDAQVRFFGRINDRSEVRRLLGASDVFVFPTRREGMPLAPMEGMAMALPVIVTRIPGVTDVACVNQETGLFVPVNDTNALVNAMERLGEDAGLRAAYGSKARQRIDEGFSWNGHIAAWEKLYFNGDRESQSVSRNPI